MLALIHERKMFYYQQKQLLIIWGLIFLPPPSPEYMVYRNKGRIQAHRLGGWAPLPHLHWE